MAQRNDVGLRERIGLRLRIARESAGLSQGQVAKKMDLHRPTISEMEAGRRRVSAEELKELAELYGVGIEWITSPEKHPEDELNDPVLLAARQLGDMSQEDLNRLIEAIQMLKKGP